MATEPRAPAGRIILCRADRRVAAPPTTPATSKTNLKPLSFFSEPSWPATATATARATSQSGRDLTSRFVSVTRRPAWRADSESAAEGLQESRSVAVLRCPRQLRFGRRRFQPARHENSLSTYEFSARSRRHTSTSSASRWQSEPAAGRGGREPWDVAVVLQPERSESCLACHRPTPARRAAREALARTEPPRRAALRRRRRGGGGGSELLPG